MREELDIVNQCVTINELILLVINYMYLVVTEKIETYIFICFKKRYVKNTVGEDIIQKVKQNLLWFGSGNLVFISKNFVPDVKRIQNVTCRCWMRSGPVLRLLQLPIVDLSYLGELELHQSVVVPPNPSTLYPWDTVHWRPFGGESYGWFRYIFSEKGETCYFLLKIYGYTNWIHFKNDLVLSLMKYFLRSEITHNPSFF